MHQSLPEMRLQATLLVGERRSTEESKGKNQDKDQADENDGEAWIASRWAIYAKEIGHCANICYQAIWIVFAQEL